MLTKSKQKLDLLVYTLFLLLYIKCNLVGTRIIMHGLLFSWDFLIRVTVRMCQKRPLPLLTRKYSDVSSVDVEVATGRQFSLRLRGSSFSSVARLRAAFGLICQLRAFKMIKKFDKKDEESGKTAEL